jgi:hypothetical protein
MGRGDLVDLDDAGSDPVTAAQIARLPACPGAGSGGTTPTTGQISHSM